MLYNDTTINPATELVSSLHQSLACERTRNGKMDNVRTHTQCKFQPERYFIAAGLIWTSASRGLFMSKDPRGRLFHCPFQLYGKKRSGKNETKGTLRS